MIHWPGGSLSLVFVAGALGTGSPPKQESPAPSFGLVAEKSDTYRASATRRQFGYSCAVFAKYTSSEGSLVSGNAPYSIMPND